MQYNVFGSKHRSNVQGNEEIQTGNRSLINPFQLNAYQKASISQVKSLLLKSETNTETETNFRILPIY